MKCSWSHVSFCRNTWIKVLTLEGMQHFAFKIQKVLWDMLLLKADTSNLRKQYSCTKILQCVTWIVFKFRPPSNRKWFLVVWFYSSYKRLSVWYSVCKIRIRPRFKFSLSHRISLSDFGSYSIYFTRLI